MIRAVTNLGDAVLLLPAAGALVAYLAWRGQRDLALAFAGAMAVCIGLTILSKLAFQACGDQVAFLDVESPSGHTSLSATFYGCGALVIAAGRPRWQRIAVGLGALALILLIGLSRLLIEVHSAAEVVGGFLIGAVSLVVFRALGAGAIPRAPRLRPAAAVLFVAAAILVQGQHVSAEPLIRRIAHRLSLSLDLCRPEAASLRSGPLQSSATSIKNGPVR